MTKTIYSGSFNVVNKKTLLDRLLGRQHSEETVFVESTSLGGLYETALKNGCTNLESLDIKETTIETENECAYTTLCIG